MGVHEDFRTFGVVMALLEGEFMVFMRVHQENFWRFRGPPIRILEIGTPRLVSMLLFNITNENYQRALLTRRAILLLTHIKEECLMN